jgi:hypothetical protein
VIRAALFAAVLLLSKAQSHAAPDAGAEASAPSGLEGLVTAVTEKAAPPDTPAALARRFKGTIDWDTHDKNDYFWILRPKAPVAPVRWAQTELQPGTKEGSWLFSQVQIGVVASDLDKTFDQLSDEITHRLGKAKRTRNEGDSTVRSWKVKGKVELELGKGKLPNPVEAKQETQVTLRLGAVAGP